MSYVLKIDLPDESQKDLRGILEGLGLSSHEREMAIGTAIGAALSMEAFLLEQAAAGSKVVIVDKDGQQHELMVNGDGGKHDGERSANSR